MTDLMNNLAEIADKMAASLETINEVMDEAGNLVRTASIDAHDAVHPQADNKRGPTIVKATDFMNDGNYNIVVPILGANDLVIEGASELTLNCLFLAIADALATK